MGGESDFDSQLFVAECCGFVCLSVSEAYARVLYVCEYVHTQLVGAHYPFSTGDR